MANKNINNNILSKHKTLKEEVKRHNRLYHSKDKPEITDFDFDQLFQELIDLESKYPDLDISDSPTQKVGGEANSPFKKVKHRKPMLSLANSYNTDDIVEFDERVKKFLRIDKSENVAIEYFAELKLDGLSMELVYEGGKLVRALTRGDGAVGEDVLLNVKKIRSIPEKINHKELLEVRGEVIILKEDFASLNKFLEENDLFTFANPRNAAAGAIRRLEGPSYGEKLKLSFFAYATGDYEGIKFETQKQLEDKLEKLGFPVVEKKLVCVSDNIQDIVAYYNSIEKQRSELPFDIDGIVIKVNKFSLQDDLGLVARSPRWATAAKFQPVQAETIIERIDVQVGRTGALTPVAIMKPVKVGGVTITNATLHNQDELSKKDVRIGDTVIIQRAGDVIPEVVRVVLEKRPKNAKAFIIPTECPICSSKAEKAEDEAVLRCTNAFCPAIITESIKHFISRRAMNMEKVGDRLIEILVEKELIKSASDLYTLKKEDLLALDRQGEKSVDNILKSIEASKKSTLNRFIYGLGIRFVGEQTAKLLADHYLKMPAMMETTADELEKIPEIGPKVSASILQWLKQKRNQKEIAELLKSGITFEEKKRSSTGKLSGQSFVVTGTLPVKRDEAHAMIEENGGKLLSGVSSKLNYLVIGEDGGSKIDKAESLGVKMISWDDFLKLLK